MRLLDYHQSTKHSWARIHAEPHYLDFENQPLPFKLYETLEPRPLPAPAAVEIPALAALGSPAAIEPRAPRLDELAALLHLSAGITKKKSYPGGEILFRAAACTGALYHIEIYLASAELPDLPAGVHHFGPADFALRGLRAGDHREVAWCASDGLADVRSAPVVLLLTSTFWRNAWKYRARAYRHSFWDAGTILANLLAAAAALGLPARLIAAFADHEINALIGVDGRREAAVALVALGAGAPAPPAAPTLSRLDYRVVPLSDHEIEYEAIVAAHAGSKLSAAEVGGFRQRAAGGSTESTSDPQAAALPTLPPADLPRLSLRQVIEKRGSTRRFRRDPIRVDQLGTILERACAAPPADFAPSGTLWCRPHLIVNAVEGLAPGAYTYDPPARRLRLVRSGAFRAQAGALALGQELAADAAVNIYFLVDLAAVVGRLGDRAYRAAQLEGGILGGRVYLASYALGLGASGLTFIDDEVIDFFAPAAAGLEVMFLMAVGISYSARGRIQIE